MTPETFSRIRKKSDCPNFFIFIKSKNWSWTDLYIIQNQFFITAKNWKISAGKFAQNNSKIKSINQDAPIKFSKTISINAKWGKVREVSTNINIWANWQTEIGNSILKGELKPNSTFD